MGAIETIAEGRYLGLYERDGWEFADRPGADGVVGILALTPNDEVILVEQERKPMQSRVIEIPAGLIGDEKKHDGESLEEAARRELLEETGYSAGTIELMYSGPTSAGMTPEITHLLLATGLVKVGDGGGVDGEDIAVHVVARGDLCDWLRAREDEGLLIDFKIFSTLWLAEARGLQ